MRGPTLAAFVADIWAPRARRRLAPKTWERDSVVYEKHIRPLLGARRIDSLDIEDLVEWQDGLEEAGVGDPTLIKAIGILSSIFAEAARRPRSTGVQGNPVSLLEKPAAKRRRRPKVWGPVVIERVRFELVVNSRRVGLDRRLAALRDALLVSLMAMTGCRPGEALAPNAMSASIRSPRSKPLGSWSGARQSPQQAVRSAGDGDTADDELGVAGGEPAGC